jgi:hypothetical protein
MNEENGAPEPLPTDGYWPLEKTTRLPLAFLPAVIAAIVVVSISNPEVALRERNVWLWIIFSAVYLFGLSLMYGWKKAGRSFDLTSRALFVTFWLLVANIVVCGMLRFAGCVCAASEISRINH